MKTIFRLGIVILVIALMTISGMAQVLTEEKILNYHSDIVVNKDGSMLVTETIQVNAMNNKIVRGIYRDFPLSYKDIYQNKYKVEFQIKEIRRDGLATPYDTENRGNGIRIYIRDKNLTLTPGIYTYAITYWTKRQLGFFKDHDELYWNVTGNGWGFSIQSASATVELPEGAVISRTQAFIGYVGQTGMDYTVHPVLDSKVNITCTRELGPQEGLTIVTGWQKGIVTPLSTEEKLSYLLKDNLHLLVGLVGLIGIFIYYFLVWFKVGRDPRGGVIIPRYEIPSELSPAAVRYIYNMKYDSKIFAAALINMGVKNCIEIKYKDKCYTISPKEPDKTRLSPEEKIIFDKFGVNNNSFTFNYLHHDVIAKTIEAFKTNLHVRFETTYFMTNKKYFITGLIISIAFTILSALSVAYTDMSKLPIIGFMSIWLSIWTIGVVGLWTGIFRQWKTVIHNPKAPLISGMGAVFTTLFGIPFLIGEIVGIGFMGFGLSFTLVGILLVYVALNIIFFHLLKAPTLLGRKVLDEIEGLKMYLSVAEKDRLNVLNPLGRNLQVYEKFLPYALALDVEQKWSEQFSDVLSHLNVDGNTTEYYPAWYHGSNLNNFASGGFATSLNDSLASSISSSTVAPGSSSGFSGGGFSGGGGGGGGGGGC